MQLNLYSAKGKKLEKKVTLSDGVFGVPVNKQLIQVALYVYSSNQRQGTATTKTRGEISGGGAKPWKQKGTGRARQGSIRSPIWKGGGVVFGPRGNRNFKKVLTKKMRGNVMRSVFSLLAKQKKVIVIEGVELGKGKYTQNVLKLVKALPVENKVLFIHSGKVRELYLGCRNLQNVDSIVVEELNVYALTNYDYVVILADCIEAIENRWAAGAKKIEKAEEKSNVKKVTQSDGLKDLKLSARIVNTLMKEKITTLDKLRTAVDSGKEIPGIGGKSLLEIKKVLKQQ